MDYAAEITGGLVLVERRCKGNFLNLFYRSDKWSTEAKREF